MKTVLVSFRMLAVLTLVTGVVYPLIVTGVAQVGFRHAANGSLIIRDGSVVGSSLVGQPFAAPGYFWSRLSATSPAYNGAASSGSNFGPLHPGLAEAARARIDALRAADPSLGATPVPVDLVTASGSGLDPHVGVAAARLQVRRVAAARGVPETSVQALVDRHVTPRPLGLLGEPVVSVLELNLDLDRTLGR